MRLKWGDPFVFDSGGKEALFLHEQRIPFEVVPGIPAAIGVPAYAGIPVTYPGAGDSSRSSAATRRNRRAAGGGLGAAGGPRRHARLLRRRAADRRDRQALLSNGRSPEESAALIYAGTTAAQDTISARSATSRRSARERAAALLVIGAVVGLREHLRWFDDRPLFGRRIVVTRSREQAGELVEMLEERGAEAIQAPTIRIAPPEDPRALDRACAEAGTYDWIVFTSANAVDYFMERLLATATSAI